MSLFTCSPIDISVYFTLINYLICLPDKYSEIYDNINDLNNNENDCVG